MSAGLGEWFTTLPSWAQWLTGGILIATCVALVTHDWPNDE